MSLELTEQEKYLYEMEHHTLPKSVFTNPEVTINALLQGKEAVLVELLGEIRAKMGGREQLDYKETDFILQPFLVASQQGKEPDIGIIQLKLPAPDKETFCHRIYICHDLKMSHPRYFTVEKALLGPDVLGEWDQAHKHYDYEPVPQTEQDEVYLVLARYIKYLRNILD